MAGSFETRVAAFNVLGSHHTDPGGKNAGMMTGPQRMRRSISLWNQNAITMVGLAEFETPQARVFDRRPRWSLHRAAPNNLFKNGNEMGNAVAWRNDRVQLVEALDLEVAIAGRSLHMPVVLLLEPASTARFAVMAVHNPSHGPISGGSDEDRERCKEMQREYAGQLAQVGIPLIVVGDFNDPHADRDFPDLVVGHRSGVDFVMGHGVTFHDGRTHDGVRGVLSDHPLVSVEARIPAGVLDGASLPAVVS